MYSAFQQNMALRFAARSLHAAAGILFQKLNEPRHHRHERPFHRRFRLGGLCAGPEDRDRIGRNGESFKRLLPDLVEWTGQWYQTNNANANPNGVLQGNWTKQSVVHGDSSQ